MAKHLVDIDEHALQAARIKLGTETIKATVNVLTRLREPTNPALRSMDRTV